MSLHFDIETIELAALSDLHAIAHCQGIAAARYRQETLGALTLSLAPHEPQCLELNRALGMGGREPISFDAIMDVVDCYRAAGIPNFLLHVDDRRATPDCLRWLSEAGLAARRRWVSFTRPPLPAPPITSAFTVEEIDSLHADAFARIGGYCFSLSESLQPLLAGLINRPNWHVFMAFEKERPVAGAALYVRDGIAWFDWAATDPVMRRMGAHQALLAARIDAANALGCRLMVTMVGEDVPSRPQPAFHNVERAGFKPVFSRANYAPK
ncbi:GNAT family N-acetyltransferase [Lacibacterium aquatile]|uniref:GNAT family N-acetyltransferase n=1 Tax=Lacibacterium aquatile TaxID=1168082 RepID=A0ABW5DTC2_9PROT